MDNNNISIAVDVMGGDNSPLKSLKGIEIFNKRKPNVKTLLFGKKEEIEKSIKLNKINIINYKVINTSDNITNDDTVNTILRNRKDSSIYRGLDYVSQNNKNSGFVSAGNTAALMILSRLKLGMIDGIDRPAICSIIPNKLNYSIMLDLGANSTVVAKNLLQFALMGFCYHSILKPNKKPSIGIINIGTEDNKGLEFLKEASDLISNSFLKEYFYGFIEPNKMTSGICDIMVSDGYTGNIILKTAEGMSEFITSNLKKVFQKNLINNFAYKILEKDLKVFKDQINPEIYNGASFIGLNGICIKSHGSATPYAFSYALDRCYDFLSNDVNKKISKNFNNL
jgi:glycerol-3-phosphate acyltransferase PlsX